MKCSAERLINALIGIELAKERKAAEERKAAARRASYVVTVSRGYGSLGKQVAQALADRLNVRCCDRDILDEVARRASVDIDLVTKLDETIQRSALAPWKAVFRSQMLDEQHYMDHLVRVIMNIARKGGVIVGRGAHLILGPERAFRVRIVGSLETCAGRIAAREHVDHAVARKEVQRVDLERAEFLHEHFGADSADCSVYDLVINSDRFSLDCMVEMILGAMLHVGYEVSPDMLQHA